MESHLPYIFSANVFLTFVDATIGYYAAPAIARLGGGEEGGAERAVCGVRKLLAGVVALYTFLNCLGFFGQKPFLLYFVSAVLAVDIVAQLVLCRKATNRREL